MQPLLPRIDRVVLSLGQRFAGDIILAGNLGRVEIGIVDSSGRFVDPARPYAGENDGWRCDEVDDEVHGHEVVEA